MFSRILVKLVDEAILPAVVLLAVRVGSVVLFGNYFGFGVSVTRAGFVYDNATGFLTVNSYSTLAMMVVVAVGLLYVLIKSYVFHDTHVAPSIAAKLFSLRLSTFIQTSFDVYSQGAIWLSYSYLMTLAAAVMWYFGLVFNWVFYVGLVLSLLGTYFLVMDVEKELKPETRTVLDSVEEVVLTLGDEEDAE